MKWRMAVTAIAVVTTAMACGSSDDSTSHDDFIAELDRATGGTWTQSFDDGDAAVRGSQEMCRAINDSAATDDLSFPEIAPDIVEFLRSSDWCSDPDFMGPTQSA